MAIFMEMEAYVSGKVQGIFFRDFVKKKASPLFLTGFVENLQSGTVHVVAEGREENLRKLLEHLHKGPFGARVSNVAVEWKEIEENTYQDFSIQY